MESIEKKNEQILKRILSISTRKHSNLNTSGSQRSLGTFRKEKYEIKSMSYAHRKQQAEKITIENSFLAGRLMGK